MKQVSTQAAGVIEFRQDIQGLLRSRIREAIQITLQEELSEALGCDRYERNGQRRGYRNGSQRRRVTTAQGLQELEIPRGRIVDQDGDAREFRSAILPRYARRARQVDEAILGAYLAGANTRRIRKALSPLLGKEHLSKSTVSRVVGRLKASFERWRERDLSGERYSILYLDGFHLKVRLARRVVSVPVLAVLGVRPDGQKVLVALRLAVSEAAVHWQGLIESLVERGLQAPELLISDGHKGLAKAIQVWPNVPVQRCTQHKWNNLRDHCPVHARTEMKRDKSLQEAGLSLLTFYEFPRPMWKTLRTTNPLENLNREFRRRTKTQGSFSTEAAGVTLLWGLVAFGQIRMRRIDGYRFLAEITRGPNQQAA